VTVQAHGIARGQARHHLPTIAARPDPEALARDVSAIHGGLERVDRAAEQTEHRLSRRLNELVLSGPLTLRPPGGVADRIYFATDAGNRALYFDDGTGWQLILALTREAHRIPLADGDTFASVTVAQPTATYVPNFSTTWWTMVKIRTQTPTPLVVDFSNPASAGDVLGVALP
jgi:hypothetical protein